MLKKYWLCLIGMGILTNLAAQGLPMDKASDQHYESLPRQPDFSDGGKAENEILTSTRQWSLKAYCPQPKNQLGSGACVGWSVGYAALTIQRAIANCWEGQTALITKQAFSPMFIYNQIKISDCQAGAYIDAAMHLLQTKGDVLATEFDKHSSDCSIMPTDKHLESAAQNKISAFHTLFSVKASKRTKIDRVKLSLIQNRPVVVGMRLLNNFTKLRRKDTYWQPTIGDQQPFGGHALVVVGFDDSRGAFELMNSWGKEWGKDGFIWVRYADFANYCRYGFQMEVKAKINEPKQYSGKFSLRRFETMTANGEALFSEEAVRFNQGIYQLKNQAITTGTIFQLLVAQTTAKTHLYAIGLEANGQVKNYWPESGASALLPSAETDLFIPSSDAGLQFKKVGVEYLVILFSKRPIPDFRPNIKNIGNMKGTVMDRLKAIFGEDLVLPKDINYDKMAMKFTNKLPVGHIIPMVLALEIKA